MNSDPAERFKGLMGRMERSQVKIAPETAMKLTFNDAMKHVVCSDPEQITAGERMVGGAVSGATAQVRSASGPQHRSVGGRWRM